MLSDSNKESLHSKYLLSKFSKPDETSFNPKYKKQQKYSLRYIKKLYG